MKRFELATIVALLLVIASGSTARADDAKKTAEEGKALFIKHTCTTCHTIASKGLGKGEKGAETNAKPAEAAPGAARKPPDLSAVGATRKADWIKLFLTRKEKIEGRSHLLRFRGTDAELTVLAAWLESLKGDKAAKEASGKSGEAVEKAKEAAVSAKEAAKKSGEAADKSKEAAKKADEAADKAKEAADEAAEEGK